MERESAAEVAAVIRPYGVGIDCHSRFIAVCVLIVQAEQLLRYEREFGTSIGELEEARLFVDRVLTERQLPHDPLSYVLESTACYHFPVVYAFRGEPSIVNPLLAGPYRRKTDKLDARTLAYHGMTGLWPTSFFPFGDVVTFRLLMLRRRQLVRERTRLGHSVNNALLRWGHTIGACGSLLHGGLRELVVEMCRGDQVVSHPNVGSVPIPDAVRQDLLDVYERYDRLTSLVEERTKALLATCREMTWETADATLSGSDMLALLNTVPGVGNITALTWLAEIVTPRRFKDVNQVSAFVGSDPSLKVSAGKVTAHTRRKGNTYLHEAMLQAAQTLMARRSEPFGRWAYVLSCRYAKGGWGKAASALSRRVACACYHVQRTGTPFSYDGYRLVANAAVVGETNVTKLGFSERTTKLLLSCGVNNGRQLVDAVYSGLLSRKGFGVATRKEISEWLEVQRLKTAAVAASSSAAESSPTRNGTSRSKTAPRKGATVTASSPASTSTSSMTGGASPPCRSARRSATCPSTSKSTSRKTVRRRSVSADEAHRRSKGD